jgi:hypothetical protein
METGSQFLHSKDSKLHTSQPVEREAARRKRAGERLPNDPALKLEAYLKPSSRFTLAGCRIQK